MWFVDRDRDGQTYGQTHTPAIVHRDCYRRVRSTSLSIRVELFRRSPMDAIVIAMQRRATSEAERIVWHAWLSVVLGLPFNQWNDIGWLRNGAAAHVPDRVPSLDEMRRDVGGAA